MYWMKSTFAHLLLKLSILISPIQCAYLRRQPNEMGDRVACAELTPKNPSAKKVTQALQQFRGIQLNIHSCYYSQHNLICYTRPSHNKNMPISSKTEPG